eukprot:501101-Prymnesium_polylepis.1
MELWHQARLAALPARSPRALSAPAICRNVDVSTHDGFEALMKQTGALPRSPLGKRVRGSRPPVPQAATLERLLENMTPRGERGSDDRQQELRGQTRTTPRRDARDPLPRSRAMSARHCPRAVTNAGESTATARKPSVAGYGMPGPRKLSVASSVASVTRELAAERAVAPVAGDASGALIRRGAALELPEPERRLDRRPASPCALGAAGGGAEAVDGARKGPRAGDLASLRVSEAHAPPRSAAARRSWAQAWCSHRWEPALMLRAPLRAQLSRC